MNFEQLTIILIVFLAGIAVGSARMSMKLNQAKALPGSGLIHMSSERSFWADWFHGFSTEMAGAIVTAVLFTVILGAGQEQELKTELINQMRSQDNGAALEAVRQLSSKGWLRDGSLVGASLWDAKLQNAQMVRADLRGVDFRGANLHGAYLHQADLRGVNLGNADLQNAKLWDRVVFDATTRLPDGTFWTTETDMTRFTNPNHPHFWRSDFPESPAFRDEE